MRVLFLHAAMHGLPAEYKVHKSLAESSAAAQVASYFICQSASAAGGSTGDLFQHPDRVQYYDFGRDFSYTRQPSRLQRARMMLQRLPGALAGVARAAGRIKPDLIYTSQQSYDVRMARLVARVLRVPHVIHIHYTVGPWLGKDILQTIRKTPHLLAVSEFIRQNAMLQGIAPGAVHTVPNTVSPGGPPRPVDRGALRAEFGWAEHDRVIAAVGRLDPMKGHPDLIEAFAQVAARLPNARLLICGSSTTRDDYADRLRRRVAALGLQQSVVFAGYYSDISAALQGADVFCLPSEMEPFGLVYLEAMLAGLPVVAYRSGAVPEIVVDGMTGLLSYPGQIDALSDNLVRLLTEEGLAGRFGEAGRQRAASVFSSQAIAPRWVDLLHQFAARVPGSSSPASSASRVTGGAL